ncbi:glycosyltransferase family 4 protein [Candidatus Woesearchaeota archaeon]|nr:glycosyltransferase family 4 protein [Candidatus Woesearchaeota archaeon]
MVGVKKPRICYVNPPVLLKRPIAEIIGRLSQEGYETSLLVPKKLFKKIDSSLHHSKLAENSTVYAYSIINPPFLSSEQPIPLTPMFLINAIKAMKRNDIIHMWVPYYLTSLKIIWLKRVFFPKKKLILTMDTMPGYSFSMGGFWDRMFKLYNKMFGWLLFGTPEIITLYGRSLIPYAVKAGMPKEKLQVIPTGIKSKQVSDRERQKSRDAVREDLEGLGIKPSTKIVLFIGLIIPRKGIAKIIRMAGMLRKKDVVFLLAGDGSKKKEYEEQVRQLKLDKKVIFLGWRTDTPRLYQASDMLVLPAEGEGLPGVVMEAMSFGVPCIASNIPCIPDLINDGKSGYLCDKDDAEEFASRIRELLDDEAKRKKMGKEALRKIKGFGWANAIIRYKELYK